MTKEDLRTSLEKLKIGNSLIIDFAGVAVILTHKGFIIITPTKFMYTSKAQGYKSLTEEVWKWILPLNM
jgi:hypothetical protein